ncbi:MAG: hypothetical protein U1D26_03725 [Patescibacteria group bacterium]|nr:hypothetical protein [Patescibacteria group bacterium]
MDKFKSKWKEGKMANEPKDPDAVKIYKAQQADPIDAHKMLVALNKLRSSTKDPEATRDDVLPYREAKE